MAFDVAAFLKAKRKALNLSMREVVDALSARGVKVADKTVYGWENGNRQPDADIFVLLCQIYGVCSFSDIDLVPIDVSAEARQLARDYDRLDNWSKRAVRGLTDNEMARGGVCPEST